MINSLPAADFASNSHPEMVAGLNHCFGKPTQPFPVDFLARASAACNSDMTELGMMIIPNIFGRTSI